MGGMSWLTPIGHLPTFPISAKPLYDRPLCFATRYRSVKALILESDTLKLLTQSTIPVVVYR
jgi:hypothetical protein